MARPRKVTHAPNSHSGSSKTQGNSANTDRTERLEVKTGTFPVWKTTIGIACLSVAVYYGTLGYLMTRVNTPYDNQRVVRESGLDVPERYWGSYRPGMYFGLKTRDPKSAVFGLMWYSPQSIGQHGENIRHWCSQGDNLKSYGWTRHDGVSFGEQLIEDPPFRLTTSFIKSPGGRYGGEWTARIHVDRVRNGTSDLSLIWYAALDESAGEHDELWREGNAIVGRTKGLGEFRLEFRTVGPLSHRSFTSTRAGGPHELREAVTASLRLERDSASGQQRIVLRDNMPARTDPQTLAPPTPNLIAIQLTFAAEVGAPFSVDIVYRCTSAGSSSDDYTRVLEHKRREFDQRFEETFHLQEKGFSNDDIAIARASLSNMVGGIGYFYGASRITSQYTEEPIPYWKAPLYTAVPSRSFFPRGFLWDEGFHGLLIAKWDPSIQLDIASHWLDLMNVEGWIPREQILGTEALARVPAEFVTQSNSAANPPALLTQLAGLVRARPALFSHAGRHRDTLDRMYGRLQAWYNWFNTTQRGPEPTSYRWRGRDAETYRELNPKTLTSGLDDYPRASHPTEDERHVDLRCWMYAGADALATISSILGEDYIKYEQWRNILADEQLLDLLHWSPTTQSYADYGLHTSSVRLEKPTPPAGLNQQQRAQFIHDTQPKRVSDKTPVKGLVEDSFGYVSLYPLLLKVLKPHSERLGAILDKMSDPEELWSPYGLRSLSKRATMFQKRNTPHDPPYWRGPVWMNVNYLAVAALHHYAEHDGPHAEKARKLYQELRSNLINNVLREYRRTGYLWENYSESDGKGSGCRPFTGWTALVTLLMAEQY